MLAAILIPPVSADFVLRLGGYVEG